MRNLQFKYAKAENFLCFEKIEIDFAKYGSIVLVTGQNLDSAPEDKNSSNGSGKSSIPIIPVYALYGQTINKPSKLTQGDVINYKAGKKLVVEFCWDDYRVVRTHNPKGGGTLKLWKSAEGVWDKTTEITRGGMPATQKQIEEIIGLSYGTFVNLYIFNADDPTSTFLECDPATKRAIVENLLSLDKYRLYNENAKALVKDAKDKIKLLARDYDHLLTDLAGCKSRVARVEQQDRDWQTARTQAVERLNESVKKKMSQLESSEAGAALARYEEAQQQIKELQGAVPGLEDKKAKIQEVIDVVLPRLDAAKEKLKGIDHKKPYDDLQECLRSVETNEKTVKNIETKLGSDCPYCFGKVDENNFTKVLEKARSVITLERGRLDELNAAWEAVSREKAEQEALVAKFEKGLSQARKQLDVVGREITDVHASISELAKVKEPQAGVDERLLLDQVEELKTQIMAKLAEVSPFIAMHATALGELADKETEVGTKKADVGRAEADLPYYEFWVKAFGDSGIRKYVIDGIIPALNSRIAYWLQFLIDNKISLAFDSQLKETIDRYPFVGRPYVYHGCSGGQRRRLNLSVAASFAYIQLLNVGCSPSAVWLDEVTMNMDAPGTFGIYRMICELAKERQVFVIDHNPELLRLLDGCDRIKLVMKDEITKKI